MYVRQSAGSMDLSLAIESRAKISVSKKIDSRPVERKNTKNLAKAR